MPGHEHQQEMQPEVAGAAEGNGYAEVALSRERDLTEALCSISRELAAVSRETDLLDRLCHLIVARLPCEVTAAFLLQPEIDAYVPLANAGASVEQWESFRLLRLPCEALIRLVERFADSDVVQLGEADLPHTHPAHSLPAHYNIKRVLLIALRRHGELIGFQAACKRASSEPFDAQQMRLAESIAPIASLALETARLAEEAARDRRWRPLMVGTLSHELRSPLQAIQGYLDLLLEGEYGALSDEQAEIIRYAYQSSQSVVELMSAALDISRLESRRIPLRVKEIHVRALLDEVAAETGGLTHKPGLDVVWQAAPDLPAARTDPLKLKMVLKNLVGNAVKFTDQGRVTVEANAAAGGVEFRITDTGRGIAPEMRQAIFEPFRRGVGPVTSDAAGAGLGLYIVHRLVDRLGGTLRVDSEVGRGSSFHVWIPVVPAKEDVKARARVPATPRLQRHSNSG